MHGLAIGINTAITLSDCYIARCGRLHPGDGVAPHVDKSIHIKIGIFCGHPLCYMTKYKYFPFSYDFFMYTS